MRHGLLASKSDWLARLCFCPRDCVRKISQRTCAYIWFMTAAVFGKFCNNQFFTFFAPLKFGLEWFQQGRFLANPRQLQGEDNFLRLENMELDASWNWSWIVWALPSMEWRREISQHAYINHILKPYYLRSPSWVRFLTTWYFCDNSHFYFHLHFRPTIKTYWTPSGGSRAFSEGKGTPNLLDTSLSHFDGNITR